MKFVKHLDEHEIFALQEAVNNHTNRRVRQRAHALLLSNKRFTLTQMESIFDVDRDTLSHTIDLWEKEGIRALYDRVRTGRPSKLDDRDKALIECLISEQPRQIKQIQSQLREQHGTACCRDTIIQFIKKNRLSI